MPRAGGSRPPITSAAASPMGRGENAGRRRPSSGAGGERVAGASASSIGNFGGPREGLRPLRVPAGSDGPGSRSLQHWSRPTSGRSCVAGSSVPRFLGASGCQNIKAPRNRGIAVVQNPPEARDGRGKKGEKLQIVGLLTKDGDAVISSRHHVMKRARNLEPERSGHADRGYLGVNAKPRNPQEGAEKLLGMERNGANFHAG
jgi:hypothetical protein